ncbi:MAG: hypothetical protein IJU05_05735 [Schwartzia sp.]|nr:hypothetical protein [Schwartzia sp. (in: firmicutes)]
MSGRDEGWLGTLRALWNDPKNRHDLTDSGRAVFVIAATMAAVTAAVYLVCD